MASGRVIRSTASVPIRWALPGRETILIRVSKAWYFDTIGQGVSAGVGAALGAGTSILAGAASSSGLSDSAFVGEAVVAGSIQSGDGAAQGTGAALGTGAATAAGTGASASAASTNASASATSAASAGASGAGTALGTGAALGTGQGAGAGSGIVTGIGASTAAGALASSGSAEVLAAAVSFAASAAGSSGSAAASGVASATSAAVLGALGIGTALGTGASTAEGVFAASGLGGALGVAGALFSALGEAQGTGVALGVGTGLLEAVATSLGEASASGVGAYLLVIAGAASASGVASTNIVGGLDSVRSFVYGDDMNKLIYQEGGTLYLDEMLEDAPTAATITIRTLDNKALSTIHSSFDDIEGDTVSRDNLVLTLPAANTGAKVVVPTTTAGTVLQLTSPGYRLRINRGGRLYYPQVDEYDTSGANVTSLRFDDPLPFALKAGDTAKGIRCSYAVDWTNVTSTFTGRVKAIWTLTINNSTHKIVKIYDVVKQVLAQPANWSHVLALRPDADTQLSHVSNKEELVARAWDNIRQDLYTMGIRHDLIIADESSELLLRNAVVMQTLYNLTAHAGLPVPESFNGLGDAYLDRLSRDKERALSMLQMPVDENEDEIVAAHEEKKPRRAVFFRSPLDHRQQS